MSKRESIEGQCHELAKILGITPVEDLHGVYFSGIDGFGRRVRFEDSFATPKVRLTQVTILDPVTDEIQEAVDLINGQFKTLPTGGMQVIGRGEHSLTVYPNSPAKVHHARPPVRY